MKVTALEYVRSVINVIDDASGSHVDAHTHTHTFLSFFFSVCTIALVDRLAFVSEQMNE